MQALVLEKVNSLKLRDIEIVEELGPRDLRIAPKRVGICGSDVHYYDEGRIGDFVVRDPLVLGHEAAGVVLGTGTDVTEFQEGDRVCMEPGVPNLTSKASRLGMYNLDRDVTFWATPPVHGCLRETIVHPADFTFALPDNVSLEEGALVEPLAVGLHACNKGRIRPGSTAVVIGAGTIGILAGLSAFASGCSQVLISDVLAPKLDVAASQGLSPVNATRDDLVQAVAEATDGWGADIVLEASGNVKAARQVFDCVCPGGCIVFIGMPNEPLQYDIVAAQAKEARIENVFRYANVYDRAVALMAGGKLKAGSLVTDTFSFEDGVEAFDFARNPPPSSVKTMICL